MLFVVLYQTMGVNKVVTDARSAKTSIKSKVEKSLHFSAILNVWDFFFSSAYNGFDGANRTSKHRNKVFNWLNGGI